MMIEKDESGKFAKGNRGGPGRPKKATEEKYHEILLSVVTPDRWRSIVEKAAYQAEKGDAIARKFLADYLIGPPVQKNDVAVAGALIIDWGDGSTNPEG